MAEAIITTAVEHTEPSQMPDTSWTWRRLLIYIVTIWALAVCSVLVWVVLYSAEHPDRPISPALLGVIALTIRYCFYTSWGTVILYGVAASVTDLAQLVAAWKTSERKTTTTATTTNTPAIVIPALTSTTITEAPAIVAAAPDTDVPPWKR